MKHDPTCRKCGNDQPTGVQVRGIYDGVCYWQCDKCGRQWNRFPKTDPRWARVEQFLQRQEVE
jgi:transposase-like protein